MRSEPDDPRIRVGLAHLRALKDKARGISFRPRQPANSILNGQHASKIKGRGLNFEELRHYAVGDDVRTIDWKVTARTGAPYVRVYTEERDRPVLLVVDQRMTMFFGSKLNMKSVTAAEAAALAAFRVRAQGDRVGGILFDDIDMTEVRPRASARALDRFLMLLAQANCALHADAPVRVPQPLGQPLKAAARIAKSGGLVMVFSDFDGLDTAAEQSLSQIAQRNTLILFCVTDPTAQELPQGLDIVVSDGELQARINAADGSVRARLEDVSTGRLARLFGFARKYGVPVVPLTSAEETLPQLLRLLGSGEGRR